MNGFPDAKRVPSKNQRARWKLPNNEILEWDYQHGEIEKYNKRGQHIGVFNPETGEQIGEAKEGRTTNPIEGSFISNYYNNYPGTITPPSPLTGTPVMQTLTPEQSKTILKVVGMLGIGLLTRGSTLPYLPRLAY